MAEQCTRIMLIVCTGDMYMHCWVQRHAHEKLLRGFQAHPPHLQRCPLPLLDTANAFLTVANLEEWSTSGITTPQTFTTTTGLCSRILLTLFTSESQLPLFCKSPNRSPPVLYGTGRLHKPEYRKGLHEQSSFAHDACMQATQQRLSFTICIVVIQQGLSPRFCCCPLGVLSPGAFSPNNSLNWSVSLPAMIPPSQRWRTLMSLSHTDLSHLNLLSQEDAMSSDDPLLRALSVIRFSAYSSFLRSVGFASMAWTKRA